MKAIGKYQIIDEIGTGAAGTTYRVRDTAGEREFALKILYSSPSASPETKDQFCRNLASYAELRHPNRSSGPTAHSGMKCRGKL